MTRHAAMQAAPMGTGPEEPQPVRRHYDISARSSSQLELRIHWFGRALAVRHGYIVTVHRRRSRAGRHIASVAYEMPLPQYAPPGQRRRARALRALELQRRRHELGQAEEIRSGSV